MTPHQIFKNTPWVPASCPLKGYEERTVEFGCVQVRLFHNIDDKSDGFDSWGAEIGGECIERLTDDPKARSDKMVDVVQICTLLMSDVGQSVIDAVAREVQ